MRYGNRSGVCTTRSWAKSALLATCNSNGERSTNCRCMTMRTPQSFLGGTMLTSSTLNFPCDFKPAPSFRWKLGILPDSALAFQSAGLQTQLKRVAVKHMPHPVHIMSGAVAPVVHVARTEPVDVIELHQAQLLWKKFSAELDGDSNDGLLTTAIVRISQRIVHHAAQNLRRHKLAMQSYDSAVNKRRLQHLWAMPRRHLSPLMAVVLAQRPRFVP